jgi:hypothetical protein
MGIGRATRPCPRPQVRFTTMPFVADTTYAPQLLVFRDVTEWPALAEQVAVYGRLTGEGFLNNNTFALLDFRRADLKVASADADPHTVTAGGPRRRAYVVNTVDQKEFIATMQERAPRGFKLQAFFSEPEALAWLFSGMRPYPLSFLSESAAR